MSWFKKKQDELSPSQDALRVIKELGELDFTKDGFVEDELQESERLELYKLAKLIKTNKLFPLLVKHLINANGNYTVKEAQTMEQLVFGRGTINGLQLIQQEIDRLNLSYEDSIKKEEFDKYEI